MKTITFSDQEYDALYGIIADRLNGFVKNIAANPDRDTEFNDITNYITYALFTKLGGKL